MLEEPPAFVGFELGRILLHVVPGPVQSRYGKSRRIQCILVQPNEGHILLGRYAVIFAVNLPQLGVGTHFIIHVIVCVSA
ncbi:hypothetical protein D3C71_2075830 [compost metagenome]